MAKELLLYSGIYSFVAEEIIKALEEFKNDEVVIRVNSGGGDAQATWGIVAKILEHGNVTMKIDGVAFSSAANLTMYANSVEALDVSNFMFHRAAYSYGGDSPEEKAFLAKVNDDLRKRMEAKIDSEKLKAMKGVSIADLFEAEGRPSLFLTSAEMKKLGIVSKINKINPTDIKAFNEMYMRVAAEYKSDLPKIENKVTMTTLAELKEKYPAIYAEAVEVGRKEGHTAGIAAEADRIGSVMVFAHLDAEGVKKIIASGKPMTETQRSEFALKAMSPENLKKISADSATTIETTEVANLTAEKKKEKELDDFTGPVVAELKAENKSIAFVSDKVKA